MCTYLSIYIYIYMYVCVCEGVFAQHASMSCVDMCISICIYIYMDTDMECKVLSCVQNLCKFESPRL